MTKEKDSYRFVGVIRQESPVYPLEVPVRFGTSEFDTTWTVDLTGAKTTVVLDVSQGLMPKGKRVQVDISERGVSDTLYIESAAAPIRFAVDPDFDVFRLIDRREVPSTLGELLGADTTLVVLSSGAEASLHAFADSWAERGGVGLIEGAKLPKEPPAEGALVFFDLPESLPGLVSSRSHWKLQGKVVEKQGRTLVCVIRDSENMDLSYAWIDAHDSGSLPLLPRKLPHYGKYSYLVFEDGNVVEKGVWRVDQSPMNVVVSVE